MENEMVGCAIKFFFFRRHPPPCHREMNILSCQEKKVMRLVLSLSLFLSPSLPFRSWWFGSSNQEELFYCYHWKHFILVSEAPTVLCGLRASQNLQSFLLQCIILEDHYMICSWGGKTYSDSSWCCFSYWNSHAEKGSEVLTDRFNCLRSNDMLYSLQKVVNVHVLTVFNFRKVSPP